MRDKTNLSEQEIKWILERRVTRITDQKETLIYPMGAERYLSRVLRNEIPDRYPILSDIKDKNVLVVPGYGTTGFLFAESGAQSVTVCDKDPVTIAWMKAFKKYYHYREQSYPSIGELIVALTRWYPPFIKLPQGTITNAIFWAIKPKSLRRSYLFYMISLVQNAIKSDSKNDFELDKSISFYPCEAKELLTKNASHIFDTAYVPYLLGITNGIEKEADIVEFIKQLLVLVPKGHILISPAQSKKEFYIVGHNYFSTCGYASINLIPGLSPYFVCEDQYWFETQGLSVFGNKF